MPASTATTMRRPTSMRPRLGSVARQRRQRSDADARCRHRRLQMTVAARTAAARAPHDGFPIVGAPHDGFPSIRAPHHRFAVVGPPDDAVTVRAHTRSSDHGTSQSRRRTPSPRRRSATPLSTRHCARRRGSSPRGLAAIRPSSILLPVGGPLRAPRARSVGHAFAAAVRRPPLTQSVAPDERACPARRMRVVRCARVREIARELDRAFRVHEARAFGESDRSRRRPPPCTAGSP